MLKAAANHFISSMQSASLHYKKGGRSCGTSSKRASSPLSESKKVAGPPDNADEEVGEAEKEEDNDNNAYGAHHMYAVFSHVENTYYT